MRHFSLFMVLFLLSGSVILAADRPSNRVLFIGIDGTRTDALEAAKAPNLKNLIEQGACSKVTSILGTRGDNADTVSGPGWSNLLTGVWPDKHGVLDNKFTVRHYDQYPHFFSRVKEIYPGAKCFSYCTWPPIAELIVSSADESVNFAEKDDPLHLASDAKCAAKAIETMKTGDPDVLFMYLGQIDATGHSKGFHPTVPEYVEAIQTVDGLVGSVLEAMRARPKFNDEHWLVVVGTDHGGVGTNHSGGRSKPEINTVFLIVNGDGAKRGTIDGETRQVDLVATALKHLEITPKPEWQLDGRPVGLAK